MEYMENSYVVFIKLYLIFQLGFMTFIRLIGMQFNSKDGGYVGKLYGLFCVIKLTFKGPGHEVKEVSNAQL